MPETRDNIHALVTLEAKDAWQGFASDHGVSITALLESIAEVLPYMDPNGRTKAGDTHAAMTGVVAQARRVDAERRKRGKARLKG
jgi:hypothetical protein